jgi:BirA family transcriptional regulator, biotin operon repressor / biotin---[acetyl-CoA-carboxylase] ligase
MDTLNAEKIKSLLENTLFSKNIRIYDKLESTNNTAKELYKKGAIDGTVILAEEQTAGRGRMDRVWVSPSGKNILLSLLLKPPIQVEKIYSLTLALAVGVAEAVKKVTGLSGMIKWPNDIYLNRKKLGGILTEFRLKGPSIEYVILGLGLNVNWYPDKEILFPSTSLSKESGTEISRNEVLAHLLLKYSDLYNKILTNDVEDFQVQCNELSLITGSNVSIDAQGEIIQGKAIGIDVDGALLVEGSDGEIQKVLNGDVSLRA